MKILVLNGSPRRNGNTAALVAAFCEGVESQGNSVEVLNIGTLKINGCLACEFCHGKGNGKCVQADDMQAVYPKLAEADIVVFASPIYYWSFSGQIQSCITRFYAPGKPAAKKYAMILSSGSSGVYDAVVAQYKSMVEYFGAENLGIRMFHGENQKTAQNLEEMRNFGAEMR